MIGRIYYDVRRNELFVIKEKVLKRFYLAETRKKDTLLCVITPMNRYGTDYVYIGKLYT